MNAALVISVHDNVATALEPLDPGRAIQIGDRVINVTEPIPRGHKVALHAIPAGDPIVKYGSPIGTASIAIASGAHVHTHNVESARGRGDLSPFAGDASGNTAGHPLAEPGDDAITEPPATPWPR